LYFLLQQGHLPEVDCNDVMNCDEVLWRYGELGDVILGARLLATVIRWLWNLNEYGMCLVNNVPTVLGSVIKVCRVSVESIFI